MDTGLNEIHRMRKPKYQLFKSYIDCFSVISLIPESAEEGRDYFPLLEESIELAQWPNITYFTVGIIDDMEMEGRESFNVHLRDVISTNAVTGQPNLAEVIIEDNDEGNHKFTFNFSIFFPGEGGGFLLFAHRLTSRFFNCEIFVSFSQ